ncbi:hypothetical protein GCM10022271_13320 [Corallibacter vietnamensis]|uniref:Uncharacterized protein n=1 Tax=Corallibacter vietnamensis TaxID=904130 RepID=A0ABP7H5R7_9FLAO
MSVVSTTGSFLSSLQDTKVDNAKAKPKTCVNFIINSFNYCYTNVTYIKDSLKLIIFDYTTFNQKK